MRTRRPGDSLYGGSAGYDATGAAPRAAGVSVAGAGGGVMNLLDLDEDVRAAYHSNTNKEGSVNPCAGHNF